MSGERVCRDFGLLISGPLQHPRAVVSTITGIYVAALLCLPEPVLKPMLAPGEPADAVFAQRLGSVLGRLVGATGVGLLAEGRQLSGDSGLRRLSLRVDRPGGSHR